jgi:hypothetical protein
VPKGKKYLQVGGAVVVGVAVVADGEAAETGGVGLSEAPAPKALRKRLGDAPFNGVQLGRARGTANAPVAGEPEDVRRREIVGQLPLVTRGGGTLVGMTVRGIRGGGTRALRWRWRSRRTFLAVVRCTRPVGVRRRNVGEIGLRAVRRRSGSTGKCRRVGVTCHKRVRTIGRRTCWRAFWRRARGGQKMTWDALGALMLPMGSSTERAGRGWSAKTTWCRRRWAKTLWGHQHA